MAAGRLKGARLRRTAEGSVLAYLLFVTLEKMAVATAPARRRDVPARPAAVPMSYYLKSGVVPQYMPVWGIYLLVNDAKADQHHAV